MVAVSTVVPPRCGLYRTTRPLRDGADEVPAGVLVNLHTHDEPVVHLPRYSSFNRWAWERVPHRVRERGWLESLRALPAEGFYVLRARLEFHDVSWPERSLVQLGYDRAGNGLVFLAQRRFQLAENSLFFAEAGVPLDASQLDRLEPLVVFEEPDPDAAGGESLSVT